MRSGIALVVLLCQLVAGNVSAAGKYATYGTSYSSGGKNYYLSLSVDDVNNYVLTATLSPDNSDVQMDIVLSAGRIDFAKQQMFDTAHKLPYTIKAKDDILKVTGNNSVIKNLLLIKGEYNAATGFALLPQLALAVFKAPYANMNIPQYMLVRSYQNVFTTLTLLPDNSYNTTMLGMPASKGTWATRGNTVVLKDAQSNGSFTGYIDGRKMHFRKYPSLVGITSLYPLK